MVKTLHKIPVLGFIFISLIACEVAKDEDFIDKEIQSQETSEVQEFSEVQNASKLQKTTGVFSEDVIEFQQLTEHIENKEEYTLCSEKGRNITFDVSNQVMSALYYQHGFFKGVLSYLDINGELVHEPFQQTNRGTFSAEAKNMGAYRKDGEQLRFFWSICLEGNLDAPSVCLKRFPVWESCKEKTVTKILSLSFFRSETPE